MNDAVPAVPSKNHRAVTEITSFAEVREAWTCPHLAAALDVPDGDAFRAGTVLRLDGQGHLQRRRTLGRLLRRRGHQYFRDEALFPTARAALQEILVNRDADGFARVDLYRWIQRVNFQLGAALVGFDDARSPEGADELFRLTQTAQAARSGAFKVAMEGEDFESEAARRGLEAVDLINSKFFTPSLARRTALVEEVAAGEMSEDGLPQDFLTLVAQKADPAYADTALAQREAFFLLSAGTGTTSRTVIWALIELFEWLASHPDERARVTDASFVLRAAHEALRLHPATIAHLRQATSDVELGEGSRIASGDLASIAPAAASSDPAVWGDDALEFSPYREVPPKAQPYGFAFGAGPHLCYGMPIVLGSEGLDGSLVFLLQTVLGAGVQLDPASPPPGYPEDLRLTRGRFTELPPTFPVMFRVEATGA